MINETVWWPRDLKKWLCDNYRRRSGRIRIQRQLPYHCYIEYVDNSRWVVGLIAVG